VSTSSRGRAPELASPTALRGADQPPPIATDGRHYQSIAADLEALRPPQAEQRYERTATRRGNLNLVTIKFGSHLTARPRNIRRRFNEVYIPSRAISLLQRAGR